MISLHLFIPQIITGTHYVSTVSKGTEKVPAPLEIILLGRERNVKINNNNINTWHVRW